MPIKIPQLEEQVRRQPTLAETPRLTAAIPEAAFGAGLARAEGKIGEAVQGFGQALAKRVQAQQAIEEEQQVLAAQNAFTNDLQGVLNDPTDDNGRPKGILNRSLDQAKDTTVEFDSRYSQMREQYLASVPNQRQQAALAKRIDSDFLNARNGVIRHEAQQKNEAFKVEFNTTLERDPELAQKVLDAHKGNLPEQMNLALQANIDGKRISTEQAVLWDSMSSGNAFRLPDKNWDLAAMRETVFKLDVPQDKKEKYWDYVKANANEDLAIRNRNEQAQDKQFFNEVSQAQQSNRTREEAVKIAVSMARDANDRREKIDFVNKIYAPHTQSDKAVYLALYDRLSNNRADLKDLDKAKNQLSASDHEELWKLHQNVRVQGTNPIFDQEWEAIKNLAGSKLSKDDASEFMYVMHVQARGKSPEELRKLADEKLAKIGPDYWFKTFKFKLDLKDIETQRLNFGSTSVAHQKIAEDVVRVGTASYNAAKTLRENKKQVTPDSILKVLQIYPTGIPTAAPTGLPAPAPKSYPTYLGEAP